MVGCLRQRRKEEHVYCCDADGSIKVYTDVLGPVGGDSEEKSDGLGLATRLNEIADDTAALIERSDQLLLKKQRHFEMALPCVFGMCAGGFGFLGMWVTFMAFGLVGPNGRLVVGFRKERTDG